MTGGKILAGEIVLLQKHTVIRTCERFLERSAMSIAEFSSESGTCMNSHLRGGGGTPLQYLDPDVLDLINSSVSGGKFKGQGIQIPYVTFGEISRG